VDIDRLNLIGSTLDTRLKKKRDDEKVRSEKAGKSVFRSYLDKASDSTSAAGNLQGLTGLPELDGTETLEGLLDDVHETGEALKRDPVFGPLSEYKKAVRQFLKFIIDNSLETEEILGIKNPKTMQQKKYLMIRVVDDRLESLAAHVLKNQADQLEILRRIDEIHGMLVDLTG